MRILVTTPTGHIGSRIIQSLLGTSHSLTVLARDPAKLSDVVRSASNVVQGSLEDDSALTTALNGVDAAFFLVPPPGPSVTHWRNWQASIGERFVAAAKRAGVERVVFLSSVGAQHDDVSAISGLGTVERLLTAAIPNVVAVRAGYFMENSFASLPTIASQGAIYGVLRGDLPQQIVATPDIAEVAVRWLTDMTWTGHQIAGSHGPVALSPNEQAAIISEVFGRPVTYIQIPAPALKDALLAAGLPPLVASGYEEMMGNMAKHLEAGDFSDEPQTPATSGRISFREFVRTALLPAFEAHSASNG